MKISKFFAPNPSIAENSARRRPPFLHTQQRLSDYWISATCCPLLPYHPNGLEDPTHPLLAVPAAPPRRACVSRHRRPFCSCSASRIPRPAITSDSRRLLPVQETPVLNPAQRRPCKLNGKAPPEPCPAGSEEGPAEAPPTRAGGRKGTAAGAHSGCPPGAGYRLAG